MPLLQIRMTILIYSLLLIQFDGNLCLADDGDTPYDPRTQRYISQARAILRPDYIGNFYNYNKNNYNNQYQSPTTFTRYTSTGNPIDLKNYHNNDNYYYQPNWKPEISSYVVPVTYESEIIHPTPIYDLLEHYRRRRESISQEEPGTDESVDDEQNSFELDDSGEEYDADTAKSIIDEMRNYHDIFMRFADPHKIEFGQIVNTPSKAMRRIESDGDASEYKGEIIWSNGTGGHGLHHRDIAYGKLN